MKRYMFSLGVFFLSAFILGLSLTGRMAWAGSLLFDTPSTSTNCQSATYRGTYIDGHEGINFPDSDPFILQVFAQSGECMRLDVTQQDVDMEIVLVSPKGTVWRNDNRSGSNNRPCFILSYL